MSVRFVVWLEVTEEGPVVRNVLSRTTVTEASCCQGGGGGGRDNF